MCVYNFNWDLNNHSFRKATTSFLSQLNHTSKIVLKTKIFKTIRAWLWTPQWPRFKVFEGRVFAWRLSKKVYVCLSVERLRRWNKPSHKISHIRDHLIGSDWIQSWNVWQKRSQRSERTSRLHQKQHFVHFLPLSFHINSVSAKMSYCLPMVTGSHPRQPQLLQYSKSPIPHVYIRSTLKRMLGSTYPTWKDFRRYTFQVPFISPLAQQDDSTWPRW